MGHGRVGHTVGSDVAVVHHANRRPDADGVGLALEDVAQVNERVLFENGVGVDDRYDLSAGNGDAGVLRVSLAAIVFVEDNQVAVRRVGGPEVAPNGFVFDMRTVPEGIIDLDQV